jgi:hypothetical protein
MGSLSKSESPKAHGLFSRTLTSTSYRRVMSTEILDYMLDKGIAWTTLEGHGWFKLWDKETMEDVAVKNFDTEVTDLRSAFREAVTELIHNTEL